MKKINSIIMFVAAAAMSFIACQKQETIALENLQEVMLTFASEKPAFDDDTKTEWTGNAIHWSEGDKISVAYTVAGNWQNASGDASGNAKLYKSAALTEANELAQFNVSTYFKGTTEGSHLFYGVYPAPGPTDFPDAPVVTLTIPANQNPSAESFDASGDLMIGVSGEYASRPDENETISLMWERLVAHAVITLKDINGLAAEETLKYITLSAQAGANLVGQQKVNVVDKSVENDNDAANVLKIAADNLSVTNGSVTFWACLLPETITSLTVEVETDKATYTREIIGISKTFKKNARNILAVKMNEAVRVENAVDNNVTDVLTRTTTGVTGTNYTNWSDKKVTSNAVYAGQSAGDHESIQLRSNNSNSGVITTASGGYAKKIVVKWNSNTASGRTLNVYGNTSAYTSPTELYDSNKQGTLLGTIKCGTNTELEIEGDYEYVGMRSASGAMYLEEIQISWAPAASLENYLTVSTSEIDVEFNATSASFTVSSDLEWTATSEDAEVSIDGNTVNVSFLANEIAEEKTYTVAVSADGAETKNVIITQAAWVDTSVIAEVTVAEFLEKNVHTDVWYQLTGAITGIYNTTYGNFYLIDENGDKILVYGLKENETADDKTFSNLGLKDGDKVTLIGNRGDYNGTAQVANAYHVSSEKIASWDKPAILCANNVVTISSGETGVKIYYTTDGEDPTSSSIEYDGEFTIQNDITVKAIAVADGRPNSEPASLECQFVDPSTTPTTATAELSFASTANRVSQDANSQVWKQNGITFTNNKASSTSNVANYSNPVRLYAKSSVAVEMEKNMTQIQFTCNSSSYATALKNSIGTSATASGSIVTVVLDTPSTSFKIASLTAQVRVNKLTVTYEN